MLTYTPTKIYNISCNGIHNDYVSMINSNSRAIMNSFVLSLIGCDVFHVVRKI